MSEQDRILFLMPCGLEYQFCVWACIQQYVNTYPQRMAAGAEVGQYDFEYEVRGPSDLDLFRRFDFQLNKLPVAELTKPTMLVDLTKDNLDKFRDSGKHLSQVCGILSGTGDHPPFPVFTKRRKPGKEWIVVDGDDGPNDDFVGQMLDPTFSVAGVIGNAGWKTYLAAALGLGVVERVPESRPRNWLSKWANPFYRAYQGEVASDLMTQAIRSIEGAIKMAESRK